jgi:hypothetical protein
MRKFTRRERVLITSAAVIAGCMIVALLLNLYLNHSAIETARAWARLAPLPASARDLEVDVTGSMFTRELEISFKATRQDVAEWLQRSPGIRDAEPPQVRGSVTRYVIKPGGGAQWAEVKIDSRWNRVTIRTYWS